MHGEGRAMPTPAPQPRQPHCRRGARAAPDTLALSWPQSRAPLGPTGKPRLLTVPGGGSEGKSPRETCSDVQTCTDVPDGCLYRGGGERESGGERERWLGGKYRGKGEE